MEKPLDIPGAVEHADYIHALVSWHINYQIFSKVRKAPNADIFQTLSLRNRRALPISGLRASSPKD
jgi:hypothetical protein